MDTRKLKIKAYPFELYGVGYERYEGYKIACTGLLVISRKYKKNRVARIKRYRVETPYSFYGDIKNIRGSKQARYALQLLQEACPTCVIA